MWFEDWSRLGVLVLAGVIAYAGLVVALRVSGKRTLAKLNAFDFVVTIALGSLLATAVVSRTVPVVEGVAALALIVSLQFVVAAAASRWPRLRPWITAEPTALLVDGSLRDDVLRRCRVTPDEVRAAVRRRGIGALEDVDVVVLETDGTLSVIRDASGRTALSDVRGADRTGRLGGSPTTGAGGRSD